MVAKRQLNEEKAQASGDESRARRKELPGDWPCSEAPSLLRLLMVLGSLRPFWALEQTENLDDGKGGAASSSTSEFGTDASSADDFSSSELYS